MGGMVPNMYGQHVDGILCMLYQHINIDINRNIYIYLLLKFNSSPQKMGNIPRNDYLPNPSKPSFLRGKIRCEIFVGCMSEMRASSFMSPVDLNNLDSTYF